jgi:hypothetical protein
MTVNFHDKRFIILGAYPESPSYHEITLVGAASSREIK